MESPYLEQSSPSCDLVPSPGALGSVWLETCPVITTGIEGLLATPEESPEMLLNILQSTGRPFTSKNYLGQKAIITEGEKLRHREKLTPLLFLPMRHMVQAQLKNHSPNSLQELWVWGEHMTIND